MRSSSLLQHFYDVDYRYSKDAFLEMLKMSGNISYPLHPKHTWGKFIDDPTLSKHSQKIFEEVIEQGYQDYLTLCRLFDEQQVIALVEHNYSTIQIGQIPLCGKARIVVFPPLALNWIQQKIPFEQVQHIVNMPSFWIRPDDFSNQTKVVSSNTALMFAISNSSQEQALALIQYGADINKYNLAYGNNPILLSIAKGWNHIDPLRKEYGDRNRDRTQDEKQSLLRVNEHRSPSLTTSSDSRRTFAAGLMNSERKLSPYPQQKIINTLLEKEALNINCIHLENGMTPLHIACLRGDDPILIEKLLEKGADFTLRDFEAKTPAQWLSSTYEEVRDQIDAMTGGCYTLPTQQEREDNIQQIKQQLKHHEAYIARRRNSYLGHTLFDNRRARDLGNADKEKFGVDLPAKR